MDRPQSMVWFKRLFIATMVMSLLTLGVELPYVHEMLDDRPDYASFGLTVNALLAQAFGVAFLMVLLVFLILRFRSKTARLTLIVTLIAPIFGTILMKSMDLTTQSQVPLIELCKAINLALQLAWLGCLALPSSRAWFNEIGGSQA